MTENVPTNSIPAIPLVSDSPVRNVGCRDTLDRVVDVLKLLSDLDLSDGLSPRAENGLYWIHLTLIESLGYVSRTLEPPEGPTAFAGQEEGIQSQPPQN